MQVDLPLSLHIVFLSHCLIQKERPDLCHLVFLLDEPEKIPRHNIYELVWFLKTGMTRMKRMMLGLEPFVYDFGILTEGYQHYTP